MKLIGTLLAITAIFFSGKSQTFESLSHLISKKNKSALQFNQHTVEEKQTYLSEIQLTDSISFEKGATKQYNALDYQGIYLIDLDNDEDLDLIYSGQNGSLTQMGTKVFINHENTLKLIATVQGGILSLNLQSKQKQLTLIQYPCYGSFTTIINLFELNAKKETLELIESTALINNRYFKGEPLLNHLPTKKFNHFSLYGSPMDFRGSSPNFKSDKQARNDSLRKGLFIHLMKIDQSVNCAILGHITTNSGEYFLIRTETIEAPNRTLFEWSSNQYRRYIGWVKKEEIETP